MLEVASLLSSDMATDLARRGLTQSRATVVWVLGSRGPLTQRVLAEALDVSARNVTGLVDALVGTGFVTREPHPGDARAHLVTLTERGAAEVGVLRAAHVDLAQRLFGNQPAERVAVLTDILDHAIATLHATHDRPGEVSAPINSS